MTANHEPKNNVVNFLKEQELTTQEEYQAQKEHEEKQNSKMIYPDSFLMLEEKDPTFTVKNEDGTDVECPLLEGLYYLAVKASKQKGDKKKAYYPLRVCKPFRVIAEIENEKGVDRSLLISWRHKGRPQEMEIRQGDIHVTRLKSEMFKSLTDNGLSISSKKAQREAFETFILLSENKHTKTRLKNIGWNSIKGKDYYSLPTGEHFPADAHVHSVKKSAGMAYQQAGTLESWKNEVASYADKNRLLALGICLSFAGSLLKLAKMEGGAFNLVGSSQTGKSTALKVAASVWGNPIRGGQIQSWRTTDNALENLAQNQNDGVLFLDEMKECNPKALSSASYMLANGCGKERMKQDSTAQDLRSWRLLFLSNGETPLKNLIETHGGQSYAGQDVRITDLAADTGKYGVFEDLYHFKDGEELASTLTSAFSENYGTAGREWLKCLTARDLSALKENIPTSLKTFAEETRPEGIPLGQISSVLKRFALCAIAGELAIKWKILPWQDGTATRLMKQNAKAWLSDRGNESGEERRILDALRKALESDENRFQHINSPTDSTPAPANRLGYKKYDEQKGTKIFYLHSAGFKEVFRGYDQKFVKAILVKREIMESTSSKTVKVDKNTTHRLFALNSAFLLTSQ